MSFASPSNEFDRFTPADLHRIGQHTPGHQIRAAELNEPVLEGRFQLRDAPTGIEVHTTDLVELENFEVSFTAPAGLKILVQLKGDTTCAIGGDLLTLSARNHPFAQLLVLPRPVQITRHCKAGSAVRKVMLTVEAGWFAAVPGPISFADLAHIVEAAGPLQWHPGVDALDAAEALMVAQAGGLASHFDRDRAALTILQEGMQLCDRLAVGDPLSRSQAVKVAEAQRYVVANLRPTLTTTEVARSVGVSARVLLRLFRRGTGQTLGQFRRSHGLNRAKAALQKDQVSVGETTELAGYGNPTSFSVAFQREFGICPSAIKNVELPQCRSLD